MTLSIVTLYLLWYASRNAYMDEHEGIALTGFAGWLVLSICIFAAVWIWPSANAARRMLGILVDVGAITFGLFVSGEGGAVLLGFYLFVIFGNGFRYGRRYLHVSQLLALVGFSLVLLLSDFWSRHFGIDVGFMVALIILPVYVGRLAERLVEARKRADEANQARAAEAAKAKDRLLAYVSRKTGEPLSAIIAEYNENTRQEG
jgi:two-component system sensor histidine kinase RpfC